MTGSLEHSFLTCFDQKNFVESEHKLSKTLRNLTEFQVFLRGYRFRDETEVAVTLLCHVVNSVKFASLISLK
jgi:hypothetical protein